MSNIPDIITSEERSRFLAETGRYDTYRAEAARQAGELLSQAGVSLDVAIPEAQSPEGTLRVLRSVPSPVSSKADSKFDKAHLGSIKATKGYHITKVAPGMIQLEKPHAADKSTGQVTPPDILTASIDRGEVSLQRKHNIGLFRSYLLPGGKKERKIFRKVLERLENLNDELSSEE